MKTVAFLSDYENKIEFNAVFEQLKAFGIQGILIKPCDLDICYQDKEVSFQFEGKSIHIDLFVGYAFEEDLLPAIRLMEIFKSLNIPVLNDGPTLFNGQYKDVSSALLNRNPEIRHLPYLTLNRMPDESQMNQLGFPLVAKPINSSGGQGLMKFDNLQEINLWYDQVGKEIKDYYIQPYIPKLDNKDFRVVVVNYVACYAYQRTGHNHSWITNLCSQGSGVTFEIDQLNPALVYMSEAAAKTVDSPFCGVDIALDENGLPFIIETNTCPAIKISHYIQGASDQVERAFAECIRQQLTELE